MYFDVLSPVSSNLSPEEKEHLSTKSNNPRDTGHTGDKLDVIIEEEEKTNDDVKENLDSNTNRLIGYKAPYYYCKEHPKFINIHSETIEHHLKFSNDHTLVANRW